MRAIQEKSPNKVFKKVVLLFDSDLEIDKIHALLNHTSITDTLDFKNGEHKLLEPFAHKETVEDYHNLKLNPLFEARKVKTSKVNQTLAQIKWEDYTGNISYAPYTFQTINTYNTNPTF